MCIFARGDFSSYLSSLFRKPSQLLILAFSLIIMSQAVQAAPQLTGIEISPPSPAVRVGASLQLATIGIYDDGTRQVIKQVKQMSVGDYGVRCTVMTDGTIQCAGNSSPVVYGISNAVAVATLYNHSCALLNTGIIQCWGENTYGQLGDGTTTNAVNPVTVVGINNAVSIGVGYTSSCALLADGTVKCWGNNSSGELGNGTTTNTLIPTAVAGITNAVGISVGERNACATLASGSVQCWGYNAYGQLGNGTTIPSTIPVFVSGITNGKVISVGGDYACVVLADSSIQCWGFNIYGRLGNGTTISSSTPVFVSGMSNAVTVSTGHYQACATLTDGTIQCWGDNLYSKGALGNGTLTSSLIPTPVIGINNALAVGAGGITCALLADQSMKCWGDNTSGQIDKTATRYAKVPFAVRGVSNASSISAVYRDSYSTKSCATLADGTVSCWVGINYPAGPSFPSTTPTLVNGINGASMTSTGSDHFCSLLTSGQVKCWGNNYEGQLGNGTTSTTTVVNPVIVSNITNAVKISV